jgi:predicted DCC family thiol-disulfide oxidoreductase YuxK
MAETSSSNADESPSSATRGASPILVFDGVCVFCSRWVDFILRHDRSHSIRFAAMQSERGRALLVAHGLDPDDPLSLLYLVGDDAFVDSGAILRIASTLGGAWRLTAIARVVPRAWRDAAYRAFARRRYRWFGRRDACRVPTPEERTRFL